MTEEKKSATADQLAKDEKNSVVPSSEDYFAGFDFSRLNFNLEEMFKSGVHFGHSKSRKNPGMDEYIFGTRNGINILDLEKTINKLKAACDFISKTVASGQEILFVGTKKQAKKLVESAAKRSGMSYVIERWLGGTFTNFDIIAKRTRFLRDGQEKMKKGEYSHYTKFEQMKIAEELSRLEKKMGGIKNMNSLPGAIVVLGVIEDELAIKEAKKKNIPVVAVVDSNINPRDIDYPVPGNDDAVSSLKLMLAYMIKAVLEGKERVGKAKEPETGEKK